MKKKELEFLVKQAKSLYKTVGDFNTISKALEVSITDVVYLIFADEKSKKEHFYGRSLDS